MGRTTKAAYAVEGSSVLPLMGSNPVADLEYRAEFWRQQFDLYEARRLAEETHANAVLAFACSTVNFARSLRVFCAPRSALRAPRSTLRAPRSTLHA